MEFQNAIVLTGGIATGKSSVCNLLRLYGFGIIDADSIAHAVLDAQNPAISDLFGSKYIDNGRVNRKELGKLIFSDEESKVVLEKLLHPLIKEEIISQSRIYEEKNLPYIIDIPLFFEKKNYDIDEVVLVYSPKEQQLQRLMKREGYSEDEANSRIASQMPIDNKKELSTFIIDNSKNLKHLQNEIDRFLIYIKEKYPHIKV
jgi:dephospho-CoA kinase